MKILAGDSRKFLKSPVSENNAIYDTISKLALSRPDIAFSFSNEKKIYFKTPGNGKLLDTMISIYGKDFSSQFDLLEWEGMRTAVSGVISRPEFKRMNRKNQVIFVNQRLIKSPMISRAIDEGYRGLLLSREYPAVILHIQMDGNDVDINVHPQKTEVRFREESTIFKVVKESIRSTLEHNNYRMELDNLKTLTSYSSPTSNFHFTQQERSFVRDPSPGYHEQQFSFEQRPEETLTESLQSIALPEEPSVVSSINQFRIIGQCFNTYILLEKEGSLFLIDQHAAHERILFNRFYKHTERLADDSQLLAFPQTYDLSVARIDLLEKHMDLLSKVGIQVELLGPDSIVVRSAPARLRGEEIEAVNELLDLLEEDHADAFMHNAVAVMACKQAIKAGQTLTLKEMETIITELFQTEDYKNCPHGRPTILELTRNELDKSFKR
ncbi:MAG: DNA mismatch repair endonuclease MutL [Bacillota bacterium]|nr:DNA mismatch repair endonuclease MutL [Bacillota bacterium]